MSSSCALVKSIFFTHYKIIIIVAAKVAKKMRKFKNNLALLRIYELFDFKILW
jgi:hypothetical protein